MKVNGCKLLYLAAYREHEEVVKVLITGVDLSRLLPHIVRCLMESIAPHHRKDHDDKHSYGFFDKRKLCTSSSKKLKNILAETLAVSIPVSREITPSYFIDFDYRHPIHLHQMRR